MSIKFFIRKFNCFFFKNIGVLTKEKQLNLKIRVNFFLKCPLWSIAANMEKVTRSWQELCGWNRLSQTLILPIWVVTLPCFLAKIAQILQKVIVLFPERGEEIRPWFWNIWIVQRLNFFRTNAFFSIWAIFSGKREVKVGPKMLIFGPTLFHKNFSKTFFKQTFCLLGYLLHLVKISANLDYLGE